MKTPPTRKEWRPKSPAQLLAEAVVSDPPENPERQQLLRLRTEIRTMDAIFKQAAQRLSELQRGALEICEDEREHCWAVMAMAFSDLRECERDYMLASGFRECEMP